MIRLGYAAQTTEWRGGDFVKGDRASGVLEKERVIVRTLRRTVAGAAEGIFVVVLFVGLIDWPCGRGEMGGL